MEIEYKSNSLRKKCEQADRYYGLQAKKLTQRLGQLYAAQDLTDIQKIGSARLHQLEGDLEGCFAVDINHPFRIVFEPVGDFDIPDYSTIKAIKILEIVDYH